jgi:hypothetical protein
MKPKTVALSTSIVPRSGCIRISAAGTAAIDSRMRTSRSRSDPEAIDVRRPSAFSATTSAMLTMTASLANSAGCNDSPPRSIHDREPLISAPMPGVKTSASPAIEAK